MIEQLNLSKLCNKVISLILSIIMRNFGDSEYLKVHKYFANVFASFGQCMLKFIRLG